MKNISYILQIFLFVLFSFQFFPNTFATSTNNKEVFGKVIDQESLLPVAYATVVITDTIGHTMSTDLTNESGTFRLNIVKSGTYLLFVQFVGYKTFQQEFKVMTKQKIDLGVIQLSHSIEQLEEVVIYGKKVFIENHSEKTVFNISETMITSGSSTSEILNTLPEINVGADGKISLRGDNNVKILLDGQPSQLDLNQVLQSLPSDAIDKIEVITNPTAKYDAEGLTGIINIITKKETNQGLNGNLNISVGSNNKYSGFVGLNYRKKKFNFFTQVYQSHTNLESTTHLNRTYTESTNSLYQSQKENNFDGYQMVKMGFDVLWDSTNTSTFSVDRWIWETETSNSYTNEYFDEDQNSISLEDQKGNNYNYSKGYNFNFNHKKDFRNSVLKIDLFTELGYSDMSLSSDQEQDNIWNPLKKNTTYAEWGITTLQVDYNYNLSKHSTLEVGYKFHGMVAEMNLTEENYSLNETLTYKYPNTSFQNSFYLTYNLELGKAQIIAGLRGEFSNTISSIQGVSSLDSTYTMDYKSLFPSFQVQYQLGDNGRLGLGYSRRIKRPEDIQFLPMETSTNPKNIVEGNPALQPTYTNSVEVSYGYSGEGPFKFTTTIYTRKSTDIIRSVVNYDTSKDLTVTTYENLDEALNIGLSLSASYSMFNWWEWNGSVDLYYLSINDKNYFIPSNAPLLNYSLKLNTSISPYKGINIQLLGRFIGEQYDSQRIIAPSFGVDLAIKKSILKDKGALSFKVNNLINSGEQKTIYGQEFTDYQDYQNESPIYRLAFSYSF